MDWNAIRTQPIRERPSKVTVDMLCHPPQPLRGVREVLPSILAADALLRVAGRITEAHRAGRSVLVTFGAHVIKCGLSPLLIDLCRRGIVTGLGTNGATLIHDAELALFGATSEDVLAGLRDGTFGMAQETQEFLNGAIAAGARDGLGLGEAVGRALAGSDGPHLEISLLAQAYRIGAPVTVHVALGTDIIHMHPSADGAAIGACSLRDFRRITELVGGLSGGVLLNAGSAVVMPEVLLKAFAVLRNLGRSLQGCLSVDLDMVRNYRAETQLVQRIEALGGEGIALTGHHEIMLPLIAGLVLAELEP